LTLLFPPLELFGDNFDCEVRASQFTLHTFDTRFQILDADNKALHLKNLFGAELDTDVTPLAILFNNLDFWQFFLHLEILLYSVLKGVKFRPHNVAKRRAKSFALLFAVA
jgi:hypothetical protein